MLKWVKDRNTHSGIFIHRCNLAHFTVEIHEKSNGYLWGALSVNSQISMVIARGIESNLETAKSKAIEALEDIVNTTRQELGI